MEHYINLQGELLALSPPKIMGIINATPDSFYSQSRTQTQHIILKKAEQMLQEGAAILDIGGYSTRPKAEDVSHEEEEKRVVQAISWILKEFPKVSISIDTFRADIAKAAVEAGACMINDIGGGRLDEKMFETVAKLQVPYVLMHSRGTPQTMQQLTDYEDIILEIIDFFQKNVKKLLDLGVNDIILDVGFGFAKTIAQNYTLLHQLDAFKRLDLPLLVGISRKSSIYKKLGVTPAQALNGTTVLNTVAVMKGAHILRVHDVKEAREVVQLLCE